MDGMTATHFAESRSSSGIPLVWRPHDFIQNGGSGIHASDAPLSHSSLDEGWGRTFLNRKTHDLKDGREPPFCLTESQHR